MSGVFARACPTSSEGAQPVAGALTTLSVLSVFLLSCSDGPSSPILPSTGAVVISTTTDGQPSSGDGYSYILDSNLPEPIGFNATVEVSGVATGSHTIQLTSLPEGCSVSSPNPVPVTVTDDVPGTAAFQVSCIPTTPPGTGNILLTAATSGPGPQNYGLLLGPEEQGIIGSNGTQVLPDLAAGTYSVGISSVPANCQVQESNPQQVTVAGHQNINVSFTVICTSPSPQSGTILIEANTNGATDPDGYLVSLDGSGAQPVGMHFGVVIENVPAGSHSILLEDLDGTCSVTGANPVDVTLSDGQVVTLTFEVNC